MPAPGGLAELEFCGLGVIRVRDLGFRGDVGM